eukprot:TRINITY_DN62471_c0_g1_i1.p1 TRINITY_DN62471_c0_g1~~TRINITY_DN62471_c0_g1_i1.p1  ORF type:complete len:258 (-),score=-83.46 TRINITY_DN62471_c0_g1_i1:50-823(-)
MPAMNPIKSSVRSLIIRRKNIQANLIQNLGVIKINMRKIAILNIVPPIAERRTTREKAMIANGINIDKIPPKKGKGKDQETVEIIRTLEEMKADTHLKRKNRIISNTIIRGGMMTNIMVSRKGISDIHPLTTINHSNIEETIDLEVVGEVDFKADSNSLIEISIRKVMETNRIEALNLGEDIISNTSIEEVETLITEEEVFIIIEVVEIDRDTNSTTEENIGGVVTMDLVEREIMKRASLNIDKISFKNSMSLSCLI